MAGGWVVEHRRGGAQALHDLDPTPGRRSVMVCEVERPAVVLGSTQRVEGIEPRAAAEGVEVVRRRSGGGAVTLAPGAQVWVDVVIPAGDPLWDDDVERATWWLGRAWRDVLARHADASTLRVHERGVDDRELGRRACFAAFGPGEVALDGRKVVGISQRRTRDLARFQCLAYLRWDPAPLVQLLGATAGDPLARALGERAAPLPAAGRWSAVEELLAQLG